MSAALAHYPIAFRQRTQPLSPCGLYAEGGVALRVLQQLAVAPAERLRALRGVGGADFIVVLGAESELPWTDGVLYLGRDERAPRLLLPTHHEPEVPLDLLERRIAAAFEEPPIAVVPRALRLVAVGRARVLEREALAAQLRARGGGAP